MKRTGTLKLFSLIPEALLYGFVKIRPVLRYSLLLIPLLALAACEKVIQIDLNGSTSKIVIQGNVYDQSGPFQVKISRSVNFDQSSNYPPVTGAKVVISDNGSQSETLTELVSGTYVTSKLRGIPGRNYSLSVKTGTESYEAMSTMPYAVAMDSIYFASSPISGEKGTMVHFLDPPFAKNYYRLVYFINSVQQKIYYVIEDELFQGAPINYALMSRGTDLKLVSGDKVTVWLESIDKGVFDYFRTAGSEGGQSASPANPISNISGGALGYFNACSVRKLSSTVGK